MQINVTAGLRCQDLSRLSNHQPGRKGELMDKGSLSPGNPEHSALHGADLRAGHGPGKIFAPKQPPNPQTSPLAVGKQLPPNFSRSRLWGSLPGCH